MSHVSCDEQRDLFPPSEMPVVCPRREPREGPAPLPELPFPRNQEIDIARACRILGTTDKTVQQLLADGKIRGYQVPSGPRSKPFWRIQHSSVVAYCDQLRVRYCLPARKRIGSGRPPDDTILPFPIAETIGATEMAERLGVSHKTACKLFDSGEVLAYQLTTGLRSPWRVHRGSFAAYLERLRTTPATSDR